MTKLSKSHKRDEVPFEMEARLCWCLQGFMIQTGDPTGTGMGGESIWTSEFEDEFHATLRHDRPYTLSMANAGPASNGSQFFITVVPTVSSASVATISLREKRRF